MSFWDALTGRSRPAKPKTYPLFDLSTTWPAFQAELGWAPAGKAGLVLKPVNSYSFREAEKDVDSLVELAAKEMNSQVEIKVDQFGYRWMLLHDPDWEDLVALVHMAGNTM
ncbi:MAG: PspA-associated protein PspAB, partial [Bacillota bacterium]